MTSSDPGPPPTSAGALTGTPLLRRLPWWVAFVLVLQLLVPTIALLAPDKPNRGGFQMYSGLGGFALTVLDQDGREIPYDDHDLMVSARTEIDWSQILPERACALVPGAVTVEFHTARDSRTLAC